MCKREQELHNEIEQTLLLIELNRNSMLTEAKKTLSISSAARMKKAVDSAFEDITSETVNKLENEFDELIDARRTAEYEAREALENGR